MIHQKSLKCVVDYVELDREISSVFQINITGLCLYNWSLLCGCQVRLGKFFYCVIKSSWEVVKSQLTLVGV